jgi:hypothetical protein
MLFFLSSLTELIWILTPVTTLPELSSGMVQMLTNIRNTPGKKVLDLPFCILGGNGICLHERCPSAPYSTAGMCFREWHDKDVYGFYSSRMKQEQCDLYKAPPFAEWYQAWNQNRCFTSAEWIHFCEFLSRNPDHAAILVYLDLWPAAGDTECLTQFARFLGPPLDEQTFMTQHTRGGIGSRPTRVRWYKPSCKN